MILGFVKWLNYVLAPTDQFGNVVSSYGRKSKVCILFYLLSHSLSFKSITIGKLLI